MHSEAPSSILLEYIDSLVEKLRALVRPAIGEDLADAIHDARVATRRLKAATELIDPLVEKDDLEEFSKTLRKLRRRLGPLRDFDVMIGHLKEIASGSEHPAAAEWAIEQMSAERQVALAKCRGRLSPSKMLTKLGAWWALHDVLSAQTTELNCRVLESLALAHARFQLGADALITQLPGNRSVDPHEIRIAGKALRYTLEMTAAAGHALPPELLKTFKRMQEELGLWHDFVVLTERVLSLASERQLAHHDAAEQVRVLGLAQYTIQVAEKHLTNFAEHWRERGIELSQKISSISKNREGVAILSAEEEAKLRELGGETIL